MSSNGDVWRYPWYLHNVLEMTDASAEDEEEEDETQRFTVWGYTFSEILALTNALIAFCLAFMSLLGKSPTRYGGKSFVDSCSSEYHPDVQQQPYVAYVMQRFFDDCVSTLGGSIILDNLVVLSAGVKLNALIESSRRNVAQSFGNTGKIVAALFPLCSQVVGICVTYPLFLFWMWSTRRQQGHASSNNNNNKANSPLYDVDSRKVMLACLSSLLSLVLQFTFLKTGNRPVGYTFPLFDLSLWLCVPMIPPLFFLLFPTVPKSSTKTVRQLCGIMIIASYLIVGALGFAVHSLGFSNIESILKARGGQTLTDAIIKDALSTAPSRFIFVSFVHLIFSCALFCTHETQGTGGPFLILFVTSLVGPAGSFGLLAAHHEFTLMREDHVV